MNEILISQLEASLATLNQALENCPDGEWEKNHVDDPYCRVIFHTLFYTDVYLGRDNQDLRDQPFHNDNRDFFKDYEELEPREPVHLYDRNKCREYLMFCLNKTRYVISAESEKDLREDCGIARRKMSRMELYIYLIRHIQHHAAQLGLRTQLINGRELSWVGGGWK